MCYPSETMDDWEDNPGVKMLAKAVSDLVESKYSVAIRTSTLKTKEEAIMATPNVEDCNVITVELNDVRELLERVVFVLKDDLLQTQPWMDGDLDSITDALDIVQDNLTRARGGVDIMKRGILWLEKEGKV